MAEPAIHDKYIRDLHSSKSISDALEDDLRFKGTDIDTLIDKIMAAADARLKKHLPGGDVRHRLNREELANILERLREEINKSGGLNASSASQIAANYQNRIGQAAEQVYHAELRMLPNQEAKYSVKKLAEYTGRLEQDERGINQSKKMDYLVRTAEGYHNVTIGKAADLAGKGRKHKPLK